MSLLHANFFLSTLLLTQQRAFQEVTATLPKSKKSTLGSCTLDYDGFMSFYRKVAVRPELVELIKQKTGSNYFTVEQLKRFIQEFQMKVCVLLANYFLETKLTTCYVNKMNL